MKRSDFLHVLSALPLGFAAMKLNALDKFASDFALTGRMPVLFLGHGNPMNAIQQNDFTENFRRVSRELPKPQAIVCISAHWETRGTMVTAMPNPRTIHDFAGFPKELFEVQYPAPGNVELASEIVRQLSSHVELDHQWGLDHGTWSVLKHLYPEADIPVLQLSLDRTQGAAYHYKLARELSFLRRRGVLIVGSGNMVHNLRMVAWDKLGEAFGFDWALEAHESMLDHIRNHRHDALINYHRQGRAFDLAIPTPEHYLPMLYTLALQEDGEQVQVFNDQALAGALTMTSLLIA